MRKYSLLSVIGLWLIAASSPLKAQITYKDVAPIFYTHCTSCHHNGGIGYMPLMNYTQTVPYAAIIKSYLQQGIMPPWAPDTTYCRFINERVITALQRDKIIAWIDSATAKGDTTLAPPAPVYTSAYKLHGTPDLVLRIPTYTSTATVTDNYICVALPTGLGVDRIIRAFEIVPGNEAIVHHVVVTIDTTGTAISDLSGTCYTMPGSNTGVGGYAPGAGPTVFPGKYPLICGMRLKASSKIVLQIHYPAGTAGQKDSTQIRFFFYPVSFSGVRQVYSVTPLQNWSLNIPADSIKTFTASYNNPITASVFAAFPHQHEVGVSLVNYAYSGIDTIPLIRINKWNFHWQGFYTYRKMVKIPAGYTIFASHTYDNTAANPSNPFSPPQLITAGLNTTNEMLFDSFQFMVYQNGDDTINIQQLIDSDTLLAVPAVKAPSSISASTFPNPFNEQVHITFKLPAPAITTVLIYDIQGRLVKTLANKKMMSVSNDLVWDGTNSGGFRMAPGMYLYSINSGKLTYGGKIMMTGK